MRPVAHPLGNPKVTLNFRGDADGGDIVVLSGTAEVDEPVCRPVCRRGRPGKFVKSLDYGLRVRLT
ncbi:MAG TPA: hypothetical protein VIK04_04460 [Solirubrobacteraceae bacterium]